MRLVIGNKRYSSWSLRAWYLLRTAALPFEEIRLPMDTAEFTARIAELSPSSRVPTLHDEAVVVWDSLAIAEYVNERFAEKGLWPDAPAARAMARAVSAEMHSGFGALREHMTMNVGRTYKRRARHPEALRDAARVVAIWEACRTAHGAAGPWLFGRFSIADAMFAPVVTRFRTYGVELSGMARDYGEMVLASPAMVQWCAEAALETERLAKYEWEDA